VNLKLAAKSQGELAESGTIDGVAFDAFLNTNGADYVWTGSYGSQKIKVTVHFSTKDPDAFMVSGTVGSSAISMNCPPESANATSFPLTGSIGGQKLKVLWDERTATLKGTLGSASFQFVGHANGSKILITGSATDGRTTGKTSFNFSRNAIVGTVSGPAVGLLCLLGEFVGVEAE